MLSYGQANNMEFSERAPRLIDSTRANTKVMLLKSPQSMNHPMLTKGLRSLVASVHFCIANS